MQFNRENCRLQVPKNSPLLLARALELRSTSRLPKGFGSHPPFHLMQNQSDFSVQKTRSLRLQQGPFVRRLFMQEDLYFEAILTPKQAAEVGLSRLPRLFGARDGSTAFR
jgi:hypothetical protein